MQHRQIEKRKSKIIPWHPLSYSPIQMRTGLYVKIRSMDKVPGHARAASPGDFAYPFSKRPYSNLYRTLCKRVLGVGQGATCPRDLDYPISIGPYANLHRTLCKKVPGVGQGSRLPSGEFSIGPYAILHRTLCKKVSGVGHGSQPLLRVGLLSGVPSLHVVPHRRLGKAFDMR